MTTKSNKAVRQKRINKTPRAKKATSNEVGNLCVHALALYTNATIKERTEDSVLLYIPYTLVVGKKSSDFYVEFRMHPSTIDFDVKDKTVAEIGERMFGFCFDIVSTP